ncbi:MAG: class I SAM-dependent methyltransferase [Myxococcota bacterium]
MQDGFALGRSFFLPWASGVAVIGLFAIFGCTQNQSPAAAPAVASPSAAPATTQVNAAAPSAAAFDAKSVVAAPDRSEEDRALDAGRHPAELLELIGVRPGMKVAEIGAGGGYTTELLARAVGPSGVVYGQNSKFILERFAEKPWSARLSKPIMKNVVRVDRDFDDPLPPEAKDLDAVVNVLFYHDTVWQNVDRARMNQTIFNALKPGGVYVLLDHSARAGSGLADVQTLHRIEESALRAEIEKAGFRLLRESSVWRVPDDPRDWSTSPRVAGERRGTSDRFALVYAKP